MKTTIYVLSGVILFFVAWFLIGGFMLIADNEMDSWTTMAMLFVMLVGTQTIFTLVYLKNKDK